MCVLAVRNKPGDAILLLQLVARNDAQCTVFINVSTGVHARQFPSRGGQSRLQALCCCKDNVLCL